jgi:MFS family permease
MRLIVFACIQTMLCAGIVFGWASVAGSLLIAPFEDGGTNLTMDETTTIFSIAASTASLSSLFLGYILDMKGPRICSLVGHAFVAAGCFWFSVATSYEGFLWGTSMIAFGGPGIQCAVIHLANLYPAQKFTVMSCVTGSITLSFAILPIFDYLWEQYGIGFRVMFRSYVLVVCLSALGSQLLWPDEPYDIPDEDELQSRTNT